jgi:hypothetical protein
MQVNIPAISSSSRKVKGVHEFDRRQKRLELFPIKKEMPDYNPKFANVHPRSICSVRDLSKKSWKEVKHQIEPEYNNEYFY